MQSQMPDFWLNLLFSFGYLILIDYIFISSNLNYL